MSFWTSFWDIIVWFFWIFVFIAYLMALFSIIGDLFRDRTTKGWVKAIWVVFLIFVPFLTALVYLIARGEGMGRRASAAAEEQQQAAEDYIRTVAGDSPAQQIERAPAPDCRCDHRGGVRGAQESRARLSANDSSSVTASRALRRAGGRCPFSPSGAAAGAAAGYWGRTLRPGLPFGRESA